MSKDSPNLMNFICQRCSQPLKLEPTLQAVDSRVVSEIMAAMNTECSSPDDLVQITSSHPEGLSVKFSSDIKYISNSNIGNDVEKDQQNVEKDEQNVDKKERIVGNNEKSIEKNEKLVEKDIAKSRTTVTTTTLASTLATTATTTTITTTASTIPIASTTTSTFLISSATTTSSTTTSSSAATTTTSPTLTTTLTSTTASSTTTTTTSSTTASTSSTTSTKPLEASSDMTHGFTLVGESETNSGEILSRRMKVTYELFNFLSGHSEIDHPLCEECTDGLLDQLNEQLKQAEDEHNEYSKLLERLKRGENLDGDDGDAAHDLDQELGMLKEEEDFLERQIQATEAEHILLLKEIDREKELSKKLEDDSKQFHKEYNEYKRQLYEYEDAQKSVDNQLKYATAQLEKLKKTNVFNTTFHIWHSGHFGTINGFRLGRLPNYPVDWNEINAAWGQTVLLLYSLANKINLTFQRYRLVPYGNHSFLESLTDKSKEFPLYGVGGFKFFWDTKFDQAMVAFLDCLQQFKEELEGQNPDCCLPYKMDKGRIEDANTGISYSVKIQFNSEEQWTKALKFMLTNLKWGLVWVTTEESRKNKTLERPDNSLACSSKTVKDNSANDSGSGGSGGGGGGGGGISFTVGANINDDPAIGASVDKKRQL